jgi:ATP-dependent exoDNAse (exonuclease V) beta subunit
MTISPYPI